MPELPEVETIRLQLRKKVLRRTVRQAIIKDRRVLKDISAAAFAREVAGTAIKGVIRRGKVLVLALSSGRFLVMHLRISGWVIAAAGEAASARVILVLSDGTRLCFCDQRVLGEVRLVDDWRSLPLVKTMGPEPLELERDEFVRLFRGKRTKIKPLLMDQAFLAGIGNIYAQEACYCAGIHPFRGSDTLSAAQLSRLYRCLRTILKQAIANKGSSIDTYRQPDGSRGSHAFSLKVYQRDGEKCFRCKTIIQRKALAGRGTCFCPQCQK